MELQKTAFFVYKTNDFGAEQNESTEPQQTYTAPFGKSYMVFKDVDLKMKNTGLKYFDQRMPFSKCL